MILINKDKIETIKYNVPVLNFQNYVKYKNLDFLEVECVINFTGGGSHNFYLNIDIDDYKNVYFNKFDKAIHDCNEYNKINDFKDFKDYTKKISGKIYSVEDIMIGKYNMILGDLPEKMNEINRYISEESDFQVKKYIEHYTLDF